MIYFLGLRRMSFDLSYMGTKRQLAPAVAQIITNAREGIVLDAFSGMCAVGSTLGTTRQVWNNDAQQFASEVASALFTSVEEPLTDTETETLLLDDFRCHLNTLQLVFARHLAHEHWALSSQCAFIFQRYLATCSPISVLGRHQHLRQLASQNLLQPSHQLFTLTYGDAYFGLYQSIVIDSIVYAVHRKVASGRLSREQQRWFLIALGKVLKDVATTTGHFAQYLEPSNTNFSKYLQQRQRNVWNEFLLAVARLSPVGDSDWRSRNKAFCGDSLDLIESFARTGEAPSVIYADPPYTDDQYSRYYHILETLIMYDYPVTYAKGLYRTGRFRSTFSLKSEVGMSFERMARASSRLGADLVVSYPAKGLLHETGKCPLEVLSSYYPTVEISNYDSCEHSTFGASKGEARALVTETIYFAHT
jgi:adenine-specific DNA-methyltransferase